MSETYVELAQQVVQMAMERGATAAECTVLEGVEFSAIVRMRQVEQVKEAGSKGIGLRVLVGRRSASAYTSDFSAEGLRQLVAGALEAAAVTSEDPVAGLPDPDELGQVDSDLSLYSPDVEQLTTEMRIEQARQAEATALEYDPRIVNSEGAGFESYVGVRAFANSLGFAGWYRGTSCTLSVMPVAKDGDSMERDYWYDRRRSATALETPEAVGRQAAQRALRRLHPKKLPTQQVPVVFEPRVARSLVGHIFEAVNGEAVYRRASFLAGKLDQEIASPAVTLVDDGTLPGLLGSWPFDDEGVRTRRTVVVDRGRLASYLLNSYTARKLGLKTTGNASRGLAGNTGIGYGNLFILPGDASPEEIIGSVKNGFYVTELIGFGVNIVTGDYSRGAAGFWIENGELAYPVSGVTIAGNLKEMLRAIEAVGNDLDHRWAATSPTLLIGKMTVAGE